MHGGGARVQFYIDFLYVIVRTVHISKMGDGALLPPPPYVLYTFVILLAEWKHFKHELYSEAFPVAAKVACTFCIA